MRTKSNLEPPWDRFHCPNELSSALVCGAVSVELSTCNQYLLVWYPWQIYSVCIELLCLGCWAHQSRELAPALSPEEQPCSPASVTLLQLLSLTYPAPASPSVHSQPSWGACAQMATVKHSSKTLLKRNSSLRDHSALFSELLQLHLCQTCPGLSVKYVTSSAKNTNAEKYFKCLYNSWCITCFLLEGKIIILAQITKKMGCWVSQNMQLCYLPISRRDVPAENPYSKACAGISVCAGRLCAHTPTAAPQCSTNSDPAPCSRDSHDYSVW